MCQSESQAAAVEDEDKVFCLRKGDAIPHVDQRPEAHHETGASLHINDKSPQDVTDVKINFHS